MTQSFTLPPRTSCPSHPGQNSADDVQGRADPAQTSVSKALLLLDSFRDSGPRMGVSELARLAGLPKSTAFRLLAHLEQAGYVERVGSDYQLGWRLFELGNTVRHCRPRELRDVAAPHLSDLFVHTREVVHLAVLEGSDVVYLEKIHGYGALQVPTYVGARIRAACCALGKSILAFNEPRTAHRALQDGLVRRTPYSISQPGQLMRQLARARQEGVSFDFEEAAVGLACVAAPILHDGRAIAAISVSSPTARFKPASTAEHLRRTAYRIARDLRDQ